MTETATRAAKDVFAPAASHEKSIPIWLISEAEPLSARKDLGEAERRWLEAQRFTSAAKKQALVAGPLGDLAGVAFGLGNGRAGEPSGPSELLVGQLATSLPPGLYHIAPGSHDARLAALAWGLGAYRFRRYKTSNTQDPIPRLKVPEGIDEQALLAEVEAIWLGRDLINTPASDLGPAELEAAVRAAGSRHGATVTSIVGDDLLAGGYRLIHAVGRGSTRPPRLIDLTWQAPGTAADAPRVTLVGKGITFDTGGLDIKPASGMLLMKKDMGGAAAALTLASMIMAANLKVKLRLLIPSAENSISGDAFRPSDIVTSRAGRTVEIGNTDAEGRLVLADALSLADEEKPDTLLVFATLTGAARVALGPDLPAFFSDDDAFAASLYEAATAIGDPLWRLPFWPGYDRYLDSDIADMNNVNDGPFAGAITAALFLKRFVKNARRFAHFDLYGWRPAARPLGPRGGEPQTARAIFTLLAKDLAS